LRHGLSLSRLPNHRLNQTQGPSIHPAWFREGWASVMFSTGSLGRLIRFALLLSALVGSVGGTLYVLQRSGYIADWVLYVAGAQSLTSVIGVWIALHEEWAKKYRYPLIAVFAIAGVIGVVAAVKQSHEDGKKWDRVVKLLSQPNTDKQEILNEIRKGQNTATPQSSPSPFMTPAAAALSSLPRTKQQTKRDPVSGTAMLRGGQATTVLTNAVTATSEIRVWTVDSGITGRLYPTNIVLGVRFDIVSENGADSGKVFWKIYP